MNDDGLAAAWERLCGLMTEVDLLAEIQGILRWDYQVSMPPEAGPGRAAQLELMGRRLQEASSSKRMRGLLDALEGQEGLSTVQAAAVRNLRRSSERALLTGPDLAARVVRTEGEGFAAWCEAKRRSDFSLLAPYLETHVELALARARAIAPGRHPYEVALEDYEPGVTIEELRRMFRRLREGLLELLDALRDKTRPTPAEPAVDAEKQLELHRFVVAAMGYDFRRGLLELSEHPFSARLGPRDVRIATKLRDRDLLDGLASTMHEAGHALYDQGIPGHASGTAAYSACSMGIHESQSRFWENNIGRSPAFHRWLRPVLAERIPEYDLDADALNRRACRISRGPVRLDTDEVTYNLHIILRFELEIALFEGDLTVAEMPARWNRLSRELLGVTPSSDSEGVLQDVHWSAGEFGYFPTYTLGSLYAASLYAALRELEPGLDRQVEAGDFSRVLGFLRERIHGHGHLFDPPELMLRAVGRRDHANDLLEYLWERYGALHGAMRPAPVSRASELAPRASHPERVES